MRYERPELVLLGTADAIVLGGEQIPAGESLDTKDDASLFGYDE
jgi:hypothetical protein